ncbi:hypothetical protein M408DRAFT_334001 [Serendipita vermifera MAFF 305830]|uniref:Uncharacterized protein n=1 Tax=Serendipita vermifera MAFF 305830 TaxID=933852 RepID=A0A0C3AK00_SERVB|nr:hypothetical protein M408DRAFT_334001 [Serendipita vermifera MAFF 305830]
MATSYNEFVTNLSRAGSSALASTNDFASTTFIAPRHEEVDLEITHTLLRKVKYHNYITNEVGSQPIFGLGTAETIELVRGLMAEILYKMAPFSLSREMYANTIFALEREFAQLQKEGDVIMKRKAIECAFISEPPMIPISYDVISQYSGGVPREKLGTILGGISPNGRRNVLEFAIQMVDWFKRAHHEDAFAGPAQHLMYGKNSTSIIMRDIWRKWDIEKDIPFPEGVERMWNKETKKSEVLYAKTRLPYVS